MDFFVSRGAWLPPYRVRTQVKFPWAMGDILGSDKHAIQGCELLFATNNEIMPRRVHNPVAMFSEPMVPLPFCDPTLCQTGSHLSLHGLPLQAFVLVWSSQPSWPAS